MQALRTILISLAVLVVVVPARAETTDRAGFIPYWIGIGGIPRPPDSLRAIAIDHEYIPQEAKMQPVPGESVTIDGVQYHWAPIGAENGSPIVWGNNAYGEAETVMMYLVSYVWLDKAAPVTIYWGSDDSGKVYVNGVEAGKHVGGRGCEPDQDVAEDIPFHKGLNTIILKVINDTGPYAGCARLVNADSLPMPGIRLSMAPEGKKAPADASWSDVRTGPPPPPGPVGVSIRASQIGYLSGAAKMAIAANRSGRPSPEFLLHSSLTGKVVFTIPQDGGRLIMTGRWHEVDARITRVEFGDFRKPGRYYLTNKSGSARSLPFTISDDVFGPVARAASRAFYYQRFGQKLLPRYGGMWAAPAYHDPASAAGCRVYRYGGEGPTGLSDSVLDPAPRDVRAGWYDGSAADEYTKNETLAQDYLLLTYDMERPFLRDGMLNIPESGNKIPDLVDEATVGTSFLLHVQRKDGQVFDRVARSDDPAVGARIAEPCSGATLCGTAGLAWAGAVWKEGGWNPAFAASCIAAAKKSWDYLEAHPGRWPKDATGRPRDVGSSGGGYGDEHGWKILAAAALYRATGDAELKRQVEDYLKQLSNLRVGGNLLQLEACHNYSLGAGADQEIVAQFGEKLAADARLLLQETAGEGKLFSYGCGSRDGYPMESNGLVAREGAELAWWVQRFAPASERRQFDSAVESHLQYLLGRNPTGCCYVTNLKTLGAENSLPVMYHFLNRNDDRWLAPGGDNSRVGCFPGFLVGGPSDTIINFPTLYPRQFPEDKDHLSPSIVSQGALVALASYCAFQERDHSGAPVAGGHTTPPTRGKGSLSAGR